jgi:hypothetical protein
MSVMAQIQQTVQMPAVQGPATGVSLVTMGMAFLEQIHGPAATIGVILGAVWVGLQIYLAIERRWFRKDK